MAVVGLLMERRKMGMVLADTLYLLIIAMPLAYLFHHVVMHVPFNQTYNKGITFYCWLLDCFFEKPSDCTKPHSGDNNVFWS